MLKRKRSGESDVLPRLLKKPCGLEKLKVDKKILPLTIDIKPVVFSEDLLVVKEPPPLPTVVQQPKTPENPIVSTASFANFLASVVRARAGDPLAMLNQVDQVTYTVFACLKPWFLIDGRYGSSRPIGADKIEFALLVACHAPTTRVVARSAFYVCLVIGVATYKLEHEYKPVLLQSIEVANFLIDRFEIEAPHSYGRSLSMHGVVDTWVQRNGATVKQKYPWTSAPLCVGQHQCSWS